MKQRSGTSKDATDKLVRGIKRKTRKQYSVEEKIGIVLAALRGEVSIAALCLRRQGQAMGQAALHPRVGHRPDRRFQIELGPLRTPHLATARRGQDQEFETAGRDRSARRKPRHDGGQRLLQPRHGVLARICPAPSAR